MAPFLMKALLGSVYAPPPATGTVFGDVSAGSFAAAWIEDLATRSITGGCGGGNYCPTDPNTRGQMAVFLGEDVRALRPFELPRSQTPAIAGGTRGPSHRGSPASQFCTSATRATVASPPLMARIAWPSGRTT